MSRKTHFQNIFKRPSEYAYDSNGNVTRDDNRGLTDITYNAINLPSHIEVGSDAASEAIVDYIYDAAGNKLGTRSLISYFSTRPLTTYAIQQPCRAENHDYIGSYEFRNGQLHRVNTPYGYITMGMFSPYRRDYQGNNRNNADYYAYGLPVQGSEVKDPDPYLYSGKEFYSLSGINIYDFSARTYAPDIARFMQPDPKAGDYHWLSPYTLCGGDPINRVDKDGKEWEIETSQCDNGMNIKIRITGVLLNLSDIKLDMDALKRCIEEQLETVYSFTIKGMTVTMSADIKVVESMDDIVVSDHVFTVVDQSSLKEDALASTAGYGIKIGTTVAAQTISGENQRTMAHELGHTGGLHDVKTSKNDLTIDRPDCNLMTQIGNLGKGVDKNGAILIESNQINRLVYNYNNKNRNNDMSPYRALTSRVKRIRKSLYNKNI